MNRIGKLFQLVVGIALAAFAASAAADKNLRLVSVTPTALPSLPLLANPCSNPSLLTRVTATGRNDTPNGNSTINSAILTLQTAAAGIVLCDATAPDGGTPVISGLSVRLSNMPGIRPGKTFRITVAVYVPPGTLCTNDKWDIDAFAGNSFNGDPFLPISPGMDTQPALVGCDALLVGCTAGHGETSPPSGGNASNTTNLARQPNKDGSACEDVAINLVFTQANREVEVQWTGHPFLVLKSDTLWPIEDLTSSLWPKRTRVAWGSGPVFIDAPACGNSAPPTINPDNFTMPVLPPGVPPPYTAGDRAAMCVLFEDFVVQPLSACPAAPFGCVRVHTILYITGDAWLSRQ